MNNATEKGHVYMTIIAPNDRKTVHHIVEENSMLIGSGSNTAIQLRDPGIASVHCLVRYSQGVLAIDDWCSATGTIVNGERIDGETELSEGDNVLIGGYTLSFSFADPLLVESKCESLDVDEKEIPQEQTSEIEVSDVGLSVDANLDELDAAVAVELNDEAQDELMSVDKPNHETDESEWNSWFNEDALTSETTSQEKSLSFEDETIEMLNLEVASLQAELETRTDYIAELESKLEGAESGELRCASSDDEHLEARLRDLLIELERNDHRTKTLEDLLHLSEDATQAEKEERQQIESWVSDIESRISGREAEWQGEKEILQQQVEQLQEDRRRVEESLRESDNSGNVDAQERAIAELRREYGELEKRFAESDKERKELQSQLETADMQTMLERQQQVVEEAVREEQLAMARERADFSRNKAELLRRVSELESELCGQQRAPSDADARFNAFREHLREINEQPAVTSQAVPLTKRLVNLWNRLEYGPTDSE